LSLGGAGQAATILVTGANVRWTVDDEVNEARIQPRLTCISAADKVAPERSDQVDIIAVPNMELIADKIAVCKTEQ